MGDDTRMFHRRLAAQPSSVGEARRMVRHSLTEAGRDDLVDTAELLVSEVVTNAVLHAGTPVDVSLRVHEGGLRVEIGDGSPHVPSRRTYAVTSGTGRGLMLLEQMVDDWGVVTHQAGKTVWFNVSTNGHSEADPATMERAAEPDTSPRGESVRVQLLNVPLLLHAAWQEHAEALLREFLLANLDLDSGAQAIRMHSEATDAIAILAESVPRPQVGLEPDEVMSQAVEPGVSSPGVELRVPMRSLPHFTTLARALEIALEQADADMFLTPRAQPEIRSFRRWMCEQVEVQSSGSDPSPWSSADEAPLGAHRRPVWDSAPVTASPRAMIAADDANRILAVSRPALAILGYDEESQLVGKRIVTIVPERYRQAHVAGFTLHFLVGRSPLIGRPVVVPALRRDGTETNVELTVHAKAVPDGRKVFVAELREPNRV